MKEQIYELIDSYAGMWNADKTALASKMESLMCYREVKAVIDWVNWKWWEDEFTELLIEQLSINYSKEQILKSIEQYKSEQK